jgi:adenylosuccinate synthase
MSKIFLVAGLGFGDEGKGATVDYLARSHNVGLVVRYNGGHQAAHNVVLADGTHHTFSQLGSASFVSGVHTYLSQYMLVNPIALMNEIESFEDLGKVPEGSMLSRILINPNCLIVTPFHRAVNRLREMSRGANRHGSCGVGIGEARMDFLKTPGSVLRAGNLVSKDLTRNVLIGIRDLSLNKIKEFIDQVDRTEQAAAELSWFTSNNAIDELCDTYRDIAKQWRISTAPQPGNRDIIFEGAQGMLLDELHGIQPYTTWTDITFANAISVINELSGFNWDWRGRETIKIGVLRGYHTRHGNGPLPTEWPSMNETFVEPHNETGAYQGSFRRGFFDLTLAKKAIKDIGGLHHLVINHMDQIASNLPWSICAGYETNYTNHILHNFSSSRSYLRFLEINLETPINLVGFGPTAADRIERSKWLNEPTYSQTATTQG